MEMLDVALTLRFQMPVVLLALANFRGLDSWDSKVLAPLVKDLMNYKVGESIQESCEGGLIDRLEKAAENVCGGVLSRVSRRSRYLCFVSINLMNSHFLSVNEGGSIQGLGRADKTRGRHIEF